MATIIDTRGLDARLQRMLEADRAVGTTLLRAFGVHMQRSIALNFQTEGREDGGSGTWVPLHPSTIAGRRKGQRADPKILVRTGLLKNSISFMAPPDTEDFELLVGTGVPYGRYHQEGTATIPRRRFLVFQDSDIEWIKRQAATMLRGDR